MTQSESEAVAANPPPQRKINWARDAIILVVLILVGAGIAWSNGAFRAKPKIAILTSTEDVYWDRLFLGGESAARYFDAKIVPIRCPSDEANQSKQIRDLVAQG